MLLLAAASSLLVWALIVCSNAKSGLGNEIEAQEATSGRTLRKNGTHLPVSGDPFVPISSSVKLSATSKSHSQTSNTKSQAKANYELKFQFELDNVTVLRREQQQQTYKCQIRLAPPTILSSTLTTTTTTQTGLRTGLPSILSSRRRPIELARPTDPMDKHIEQNRSPILSAFERQASANGIANVTLAIDWLKDDKPLVPMANSTLASEPISVVNVELNRGRHIAMGAGIKGLRNGYGSGNVNVIGNAMSNLNWQANLGSNGQGTSLAVSQATNKHLRANASDPLVARNRIEIKNTLNSNQLKLTSRLKLSRLRQSDSASYRCVARASYLQPIRAPEDESETGATTNAHWPPDQRLDSGETPPSSSSAGPMGSKFELIEQTLESSSASNLMVIASDTSDASPIRDSYDNSNNNNNSSNDSATTSVAPSPSKEPPTSQSSNAAESHQSQQRRTHLSPPAGANKVNSGAQENRIGNDNNVASARSRWTQLWSDFSLAPSAKSAHTKGDKTVSHLTDEDVESANEAASNDNSDRRRTFSTNQFEDDEDLFRLDASNGNSEESSSQSTSDLISSDQQSLQDQLSQLVWSSLSSAMAPSASSSSDHIGDDERDNQRTSSLLLFPLIGEAIVSTASTPIYGSNTDDENDDNELAHRRANESLQSTMDSANEVQPSSASSDEANAAQRQQKYRLAQQRHQKHQTRPTSATGRAPSGLNGGSYVNGDGKANDNSDDGDGSTDSITTTPTKTQSTSTPARHLTHFMHAISPTLGHCYTNNGKQYAGNISTSSDGRVCLNWILVRQLVLRTIQANSNATTTANGSNNGAQLNPSTLMLANIKNTSNYNHNHCRNPSHDSRGPYCYVIYSSLYDGPIETFKLTSPVNNIGAGPAKQQNGVHSGVQRYVIARQCSVSRCSEYLWLMVAAPPIVVLMLLVCIMIALVRSIRRARYNAIFASGNSYRKCQSSSSKKLPDKLSRLKGNCATKVMSARKAFGASGAASAKPYGGYLDDEAFEIVDDIDWSDSSCAAGSSQMTKSQSLSPKSCESFRLNHSATTCSSVSQSDRCDHWTNSNNVITSNLTSSDTPNEHSSKPLKPIGATCYRSMNPIFNERIFDTNNKLAATDPAAKPIVDGINGTGLTSSGLQMSRKLTAEPMFATLRCPVRVKPAAHQTGPSDDSAMQSHHARLNKCLTNKSNSFIGKPGELGCQQRDRLASERTKWSGSFVSSGQPKEQSALADADYQSVAGSTHEGSSDHIVNTTDDCLMNESKTDIRSLPKLVASSVAIAYNRQPIFEGKFSQVHLARYIKLEPKVSAQQAADIGAQVAVFSLKHTANVDLNDLFVEDNLRVLNLNHLNVTKLIGYTTIADLPAKPICSLVFDMAQLIDLQDWLKQQARDTAQMEDSTKHSNSNTSLRQNLACFAKQIALALDYLHDKTIIYKDLACRNCFLDPTKMLVKLASFNLEPVILADERDQASNNSDPTGSKVKQVKSMIRPNHLPDYYVIDSRPTECQLLPLSWIPLESILFNKFNEQTDIWSFGCLLYELYSFGEVPFFGYSSKSIIDAVRANIMPPQPMLCPNGIYRLMCKCLSDIPTLRPTVKQVYEQLILYSGQCSSFLDHHLCSLATVMSNSSTQPVLVAAGTSGFNGRSSERI